MQNYNLVAIVTAILMIVTSSVFAGDKAKKNPAKNVVKKVVTESGKKIIEAGKQAVGLIKDKKTQKQAEKNLQKQLEFAKQKKKEIAEKQKKQKEHPTIPVKKKPPSK